MQVPTTIDGLKQALKLLGFDGVLDGFDPADPDLKTKALAEVEYVIQSRGDQPGVARSGPRAIAMLQSFQWVLPMQAAVAAIDAARQLLLKPKTRYPAKNRRAPPITVFDGADLVTARLKRSLRPTR